VVKEIKEQVRDVLQTRRVKMGRVAKGAKSSKASRQHSLMIVSWRTFQLATTKKSTSARASNLRIVHYVPPKLPVKLEKGLRLLL
jgi:hypothetical protein